jgi:hypothetical protein
VTTFEVLPPVQLPSLVTSGAVLVNPLVATDAVALNLSLAAMWVGHGAPGVIIGSRPGDEYVDLDTGDVYELD